MGIFDFLMNSKDFYRRGYKKAYKSNWDFKGAIKDYTKAIELDPNYEEAYFQRANAKHSLKDYYGAIEDFTKAIEKCGHLSVFELLSYEGRVESKEKIKDFKGAIKDCSKLIELFSEESYSLAYSYYKRGFFKENIEDYDGAINDFTKIIESESGYINPAYISKEVITNTYFQRGHSKFKKYKFLKNTLENIESYDGFRNYLLEAITDFTSAISFKPDFTISYFNRGLVRSELNGDSGAIEDFTKAIDIDPNNAAAFHSRGISKEKIKDYEGAMADIEKAIEIETDDWTKNRLKEFKERIHNKIADSDSIDNSYENDIEKAQEYLIRGIVKSNSKDYKSAISDFDKAIKLNPNFDDAYNNRGVAKEYLTNYNGAIEDYNKFIELNPNNAIVYYNRGKVKIKLNESEEALEDFDKAIKLNPNFVEAYNNRGLIKSSNKNHIGAIDDFNKAIELKPDFNKAYFNRGLSKEKLSDHIGAIKDFTQVIESNPTNLDKSSIAKTYFIRGISKENTKKDYEGAMSDLEKAIEIETNDNLIKLYKKSLKEFNERMQNIVNHMTSDKHIENLVKGIKNDMEKKLNY